MGMWQKVVASKGSLVVVSKHSAASTKSWRPIEAWGQQNTQFYDKSKQIPVIKG